MNAIQRYQFVRRAIRKFIRRYVLEKLILKLLVLLKLVEFLMVLRYDSRFLLSRFKW